MTERQLVGGSVFGSSFITDPNLRRMVLKVAITSNALDEHGLELKAEYFGHPSTDIHAYIAKLVERYHRAGDVPGFEILASEVEHSFSASGASFTKEDALMELKEIEATDASAVNVIAADFSAFVSSYTAVRAIQDAYSSVMRAAERGKVDLDDVIGQITEKASQPTHQRGYLIEDVPPQVIANKIVDKIGLDGLDAISNGMREGEFFLFLGAPKGRKTSFLVNSAVGALLGNPDCRVCFISYELSVGEICERIDRVLLTRAIHYGYSGPEDRRMVIDYLGIRNRLYVAYLPASSTARDAYRLIKKISSSGFKPHLVVLDWLMFMMPVNKKTERRHELAEVARDIAKLAKSLKCAVLSAHLLKRDSLKKKRGEFISRIDVAESYEVIAVVDAAIAISFDVESPNGHNEYELRIIAARRFEDDVSAGVYRVAYDGYTIESASASASFGPMSSRSVVATADVGEVPRRPTSFSDDDSDENDEQEEEFVLDLFNSRKEEM